MANTALEVVPLLGLGRGGMADIQLATDAEGRLVILKTLRPPITDRRVQMFLDEARIGLLLDHPNIVRTFAVGESEGRHSIVMEFLDGQPLDRILQRVAKDDARRPALLWMLAEALAGLHHAHELAVESEALAIVHRDLSPQNVFVTYDGAVKVLDFGIAKAVGGLAKTTAVGEVRGKVRYMAPEQALGLKVDRRADVFAAGVVLWELVAGEPFWPSKMADRDVFDELVGGAYPTMHGGAGGAIDDVLRRALARDASERYATADEMRRDLLAALGTAHDLGTLPAAASALVAGLFTDERIRTAKMIERARAGQLDPGRGGGKVVAVVLALALGGAATRSAPAHAPDDMADSSAR